MSTVPNEQLSILPTTSPTLSIEVLSALDGESILFTEEEHEPSEIDQILNELASGNTSTEECLALLLY